MSALKMTVLWAAMGAGLWGSVAVAAEAEPKPAAKNYSPYPAIEYPQNLYWGDTHVHSSWSPDAGGAGNERLTPADAYRFARGEEITAHNGQKVQLRRPLDFLLVSDHSEYLGLYPMLLEKFPPLIETERGARWLKLLEEGRRSLIGGEFALSLPGGKDIIGDRSFVGIVWQRAVDIAERANDPGRFTAFIGYEWTSMPGGANLHRNVLFRDGADRTRQILPFSSIEGADPEDLWAFFERYEEDTGGRVMAIPHNGNLSAGRMFEKQRFDGTAMTKGYAASRQRWERVVEATQIKGIARRPPSSRRTMSSRIMEPGISCGECRRVGNTRTGCMNSNTSGPRWAMAWPSTNRSESTPSSSV